MVTGHGAETWVNAQLTLLNDLAARLSVPPIQLAERVEALLAEVRQRQSELETLRGQMTRGALTGLLDQIQRENGVALLVARVDAPDMTHLREMGDWLRDKLGSGIVVLGTVVNEKPQLLTMVTLDLVQQGYHAGNLVKALAQIVGGGGGGRPDMAQAGGRDVNKLDTALAQVRPLVRQQAR